MNAYEVTVTAGKVEVTAAVPAANSPMEAYQIFLNEALIKPAGCLMCSGGGGKTVIIPLQALGPVMVKKTGPALIKPEGIVVPQLVPPEDAGKQLDNA